MIIEVTELIWKDVSIRNEIKSSFTVTFLHSDDIETKTIFASDLMTLRKMVNFLVLIKTFILIRFARARTPQKIPLMRLSVWKSMSFKDSSDKFIFKSYHLEQQLWVFNVITFLVLVKRHRVCAYSFIWNVFKVQKFWSILVLIIIKPACSCATRLWEKAWLAWNRWSICRWSCRCTSCRKTLFFVFNVFYFLEYFQQ